MSIIDYFKLQAKNLMRDWKTHQDDEELGYVYAPRFFDIDGILMEFDEDEEHFCLQRALHLIAKLVGFKKWNELINATDDELKFAKTVFDGLMASNDMISAYEQWQDYYYSDGISNLDVRNQIYIAQQYFQLPVDDEFKRDNPIQDRIDRWYSNLKPFIEQAVLIDDFIRQRYEQIKVLTDSSRKITEEIKFSIHNSLTPLYKQIIEANEIIKKYHEGLDKIINETTVNADDIKNSINDISEKSLAFFGNSITKLIPEVIDKSYTAIKMIRPESTIESTIVDEFESLIDTELDTQKAMINELKKRNVTDLRIPTTSKDKKENRKTIMEEKEMTGKEIRAEYWKYAVSAIKDSVPEVFGKANLHEDRSAFDGIARKGIPQLTCIARIEKPSQISVGVYFKNDNSDTNKKLFDFLNDKKDEILSRIPFKDVRIEPAKGTGRQPDAKRLHYNLLATTDLNVLDKNDWNACRDFHSKVAKILYDYVIVELSQEIQKMI